MSILHGLRARLRALGDSRRADGDLREEIRFHLEQETAKNERLGMSPAEARRVALAHFGGVDNVREAHHDVRRLRWLGDVAADARFALRTLRRTPALTGAAVLTIALGIGANVAIFSAVNAVVLQPLPFPQPDRLVMITEENPEKKWHLQVAAPANMFDWRAGVADFADVMGYVDGIGHLTMTGRGDPTLLSAQSVTGNFFSTLGVHAALGRTLRDEETWRGGTPLAVLSDAAWRSMFNADSSIVGRSVVFDGRDTQIVGVMPPGFSFPVDHIDAWVPVGLNPATRYSTSARRAHWLRVVARLRPGASLREADAQLQAVVSRLARDYPATNKSMGAAITPLHDFLVGNTRLPLLVLLTSVAFLLLIACANVGNLLLVQATGRQRETALRLALGAGRARLVRQALTESLVLSIIGGACGAAIGWVGTRALVRLQPAGIMRVQEFGVDERVMLYVVVITIVSGLLFGIAPALWARRRDPADTLKDGGRSMALSGRGKRWGEALVVGEVALALLMTVGAGLLVRSFWRLARVDGGFDPHGVLAVQVALDGKYDSVTKVEAFMNQLVVRARAIPGVSAVALASDVPLTGTSYTSDFIAAGRPPEAYGSEIGNRSVSPDYFTTMRVPVLRGRVFTAEDRRGGAPVTVINDALARSYFAGQNPVGQRIAFEKAPTPQSTWYTIIGVVGSERVDALDVAPRIEAFHSIVQEPASNVNLLLRTSGDAAGLTPSVRAVVRSLDPRLALLRVRTMDALRDDSMARMRFLTIMLAGFATIGLVLSVVGVYGVLAQLSRNRTREMGIRLALGAPAREVRWLVVRHGLNLTIVGLVVGAAIAVFATKAMAALLFEVAPNDPATILAVAALLAATSVVAAWVPARKASRADPVSALRGD